MTHKEQDKTYIFNGKGDNKWAKEWFDFITDLPLSDNDPEWENRANKHKLKMAASLIGREATDEEINYFLPRKLAINSFDKLIKIFDIPYDMKDFLPEVLKDIYIQQKFIKPLFIKMRDKLINELRDKNLWLNDNTRTK